MTTSSQSPPQETLTPSQSEIHEDDSQEELKPGVQRFGWRRIKWDHFFGIASMHVLALFAPSTFSWGMVLMTVILYNVICGFGISMGYHRLLTHKGFETSKAFYYFLAIMGTLNFQGGPIMWVGTHRVHHRDSDTEHDPHSPRHGFLWAHLLWCVAHDPFGRDCSMAAKDLKKDRGMVFLDKYFWVPSLVLAGVLFAIGGWPAVVWGMGVRVVFTYHATWLVNSASHTWGYKNFKTKDDSKNNWWVALISFGEGWHNNHHAHQRSARHGMRWFEFDPTYLVLRVLEVFRIVRNIYVPKALPKG